MQDDKKPEEGLKCTVDELIEYCKTLQPSWVPTEKNANFRFKSGLTIDEIIGYVRTLRKEYFQEEIDDLDAKHSGKMYVFKRLIEDKYWCYIKVKINRTKEGKLLLVISFHEDEKMI